MLSRDLYRSYYSREVAFVAAVVATDHDPTLVHLEADMRVS